MKTDGTISPIEEIILIKKITLLIKYIEVKNMLEMIIAGIQKK